MLFVTSVIIFLTLLNIIVYYLQQHHDKEEEEEEYGERNDTSFLLSNGLCRRFSLGEIKSATQNFDEELVIGKGGFGKVYKGVIDKGASTVAIKRLGLWSNQGAPEFRTEIEMLSKFRHSHLATLIGYCSDHPEMILVYEYMPSGTLGDNLHKVGRSNLPLSWVQRLKICLGAARGLDYLHTGTNTRTRVIHRDVKSSNILLDSNLEAKISDFGLSKIGPAEQTCTHVSTHVKGTVGYLDPEYFLTHRLTRKSDVYAFGVVMFEALCGRPAVDVRLDEEQWGLAKWAKHCINEGRLHDIVDPHLRGSILSKCLESYAKIAEQCLHKSSRKRPTMAEVVTRLEYALALQETTDLSLMDAEIIRIGRDYDNQEGADSSTEAEVTDAGGGNLSIEQKAVDAGAIIFSNRVPVSSDKTEPSFESHLKEAEKYSDFPLQQLKRFSLHEIQVATDNFSSKNILGRGGFSKVYKGCLVDGSLVAVKRLVEKPSQAGELQFKKEVEVIWLALDCNLLQLRGFCSTPTERLLVYPYMGKGSVASRLREHREGQSALDWRTRKRIALGSARGLACLHDDYIVHGNIKAASIFLTEFSDVVIGNFGFAQHRYQNIAHLPALVRGPSVYLAPEYLSTGKCSLKTDVFGYGLMLLELISGQGAFDLPCSANDDNVTMLDWVKGLVRGRKLRQLVDVYLPDNYAKKDVKRLTKVALLCTQTSPMKRPRMSEVVKMLQGDGLPLNTGWSPHL